LHHPIQKRSEVLEALCRISTAFLEAATVVMLLALSPLKPQRGASGFCHPLLLEPLSTDPRISLKLPAQPLM